MWDLNAIEYDRLEMEQKMKKQIYIVKTKMFDGTWLAMAFCETIAEAEKELEILYARGRLNSKIFTV
jgi:hypothetical protein